MTNTPDYSGEIFHDYFAISGGGEKLVLNLAEDLNWQATGGFISEQFKQLNHTSLKRLNSLNAYSGFKPLQMLSLIYKWEHFKSLSSGYNIVYSGVYVPLAAVNHQDNHNILYCHTPPRFVYDKKNYYLKSLPRWQHPLFKLLISFFQKRYEQSLDNMDQILVNSRHVQERVKNYLNKNSKVVYPPCDTIRFRWQSQGDYYLSTARLDGLKRVEVIVKAFIKMPDKKLIVCSGGPELDRLKQLAENSANISFTDWISHNKLVDLVSHCIATIYIPWDEDFGISPIESMAAGKPVIGVNEGGLKETIVDQQTGYLLDTSHAKTIADSTLVEGLIERVKQLNPQQALSMRDNCEQRAKLFSEEQFLQQMKLFLK
jgi:glycosyltransferase involved in cell wall biosynthesis